MFTDEQGQLTGLTTELTGVVRPLVTNIGGATEVTGEALVVGPVANNLLTEAGTAVVVLGNDFEDENNAVLAGLGGTVEGVGTLVVDAGGILTVSDGEPGGDLFELSGLLGDSVSPLENLTGTTGGLLGGDTSELIGTDAGLIGTVGGVLGAEEGGLLDSGDGLVGTVGDTVDGVLGGEEGGLLDSGDGLVGTVGDTVDGVLGGEEGGLLDSGDGLVGTVGDTVDGVLGGEEGGLLDDDSGLVGTVGDSVDGLLGGDSEDVTDDGIVDGADDALLDPILGGIL